MSDPLLATLRLPIPWHALGFPETPTMGATTLVDGDRSGWAWEGSAPAFGVDGCPPADGDPVDGWIADHVVLLVPALDDAIAILDAIGLRPRLRTAVRGRATAFYRVGPVLEVIESPVRGPALYGVALATTEPLEVVALRWRSLGFEVTDPRPAMQPSRRIMTVKGLAAGLAVMTPDRASAPDQ